MIHYMLLFSRHGKVRLQKWFTTYAAKEQSKIMREVVTTVLQRKPKMCNVLEWQDKKVIYKRYASLFFAVCIDPSDNELLTLEIVHRYVETLDKYFGNVCELDIVFNFDKAYFLLDELLIAGEMQESSRKIIVHTQKKIEQTESEDSLADSLRSVQLM